MRHHLTVTIQFPALDRLITFLDGQDQKEVDAATAQIKANTARLSKSSSELQGSVDQTTKEL